jgi:hypothetical protein
MRLVRVFIATSVMSAALAVLPAAAQAAPAKAAAAPDSLLRVCVTLVTLGVPRICVETPV